MARQVSEVVKTFGAKTAFINGVNVLVTAQTPIVAGKRAFVTEIWAGYSAAPSAFGRAIISLQPSAAVFGILFVDGALTQLIFPEPIEVAPGQQLRVTLPAGGATVEGTITIVYWPEP